MIRYADRDMSPVICEAIALLCLNSSPSFPEREELRKKAAESIFSRMGGRFFTSENIGETFLALSALFEYDSEFLNGAVMAEMIMKLASVESEEGGPYYSSPEKIGNIDIGVNACIAYFLFLQDVSLPSLISLTEEAIDREELGSDIFDSCYPVIFIISKYYNGERKEKLIDIARSLGEKAESELEKTLIALSLESLERESVSSACGMDDEESKMTDLIIDKARSRFSVLRGEIREIAMRAIKRTMEGNKDRQMSLMPFYMKKALGRKGETISDELVADIGLTNIFFWTAFIIYDDFWDEDEKADPEMLPAANLFARHYSCFFSGLFPEESGFNLFFDSIMDKLDASNAWETVNCRTKVEGPVFFIPDHLPEYGDYALKYYPASGHILGPVAMFYLLGYGDDSEEVKALISYFRNYLIAMQINDDAHDWEEDIRRGHLSTVVVPLVESYMRRHPEADRINLDNNLDELKEIFWLEAIVPISAQAIRHTEESRVSLDSVSIIENKAPLYRFIDISENIAKKAIKEQGNSTDFISAYKEPELF